ncbi:salutaridinol 7-O-acetyltransferase-like [Papaver somniferum]|uniref:salutaridinol 7-O-acetyltransferase-like n=1 Tax=Papaver somniferum TaxID=3469 RepID=UPI000E7013C0|nr:salutaridinol 7-O-acetyltransferase-like [Papaver somniferum]
MNDHIMKIEIVSNESIRPSSPTPDKFNTHILSRFDQIFPPYYVSLLLYYLNLDSNSSSLGNDEKDKNIIFSESSRHRCDVLKKSLAETLTRYYPLAGRIKDEKSVDCNDKGVDYIEARVVGRVLSQVMQLASSDIGVIQPFLAFDEPYGETGSNSKALLKIQVNVFDGGGMVISLIYCHRILDGSSFINFVKDWAAISRSGSSTHGDELKVAAVDKPCYVLSSMFPPTTCMSFGEQEKNTRVNQIVAKRTELMTKRFVFKNSSIAKLMEKCIHDLNANKGSDCQVDNEEENMHQLPTRFEALTALIWMCFMDVDHHFKVKQIEDGVTPINAVSTPKQVQNITNNVINLRSKMIPPLLANSFGNMTDVAIAEVSRCLTGRNLTNNGNGFHDQISQYYQELVSKIKNSIKSVDNEHMKALQGNKFAISCNRLKIHQGFGEGHTCNV